MNEDSVKRTVDSASDFVNENSQENEEQIERIRDEEYFVSQIEGLKVQLQEKEQEYKKLSKDYDVLQNKYMSIKEDTSSFNEDLISRYRAQSESLAKRLEQTQNDMSKMRKIKNSRIDSLESLVDDLQNKSKELNVGLQKKINSDLENLNKSAQVDKLMEQVHGLEMQKAELNQQIEEMRIEVVDANTRANDIERILLGVSGTLNRTNEKINKVLKIKADLTQKSSTVKPQTTENKDVSETATINEQQMPEIYNSSVIDDRTLPEYQTTDAISIDSASKVVNVPSEETSEVHAEPFLKTSTPAKERLMLFSEEQHAEQERALDEIRKSQQERKKGFFSWLSNRAASFLP